MSWFSNFLTSSIGQKLVMSLTGLFLITFLLVHLVGNLQLLASDQGESFNTYAYFMTTNPLIKTVSYGLYFFIVVHTIQGLVIAYNNRKAKGSRYAVKSNAPASSSGKTMALLGTLILAFLLIHMGDFWYKMKFTDQLEMVPYDSIDVEVKNLYKRVSIAFQNPVIVIIYIIGQIVLALHLWHGFQSAFQTLGINHKKYTPAIQFLGKVYSIVIPIGFAIIPIVHYFS